MNKCYLGLGSNQKFPERQIRRAIAGLQSLPRTAVCRVSSLYWSKAWGRHRQQDFCNVVVELVTYLPPEALLTHCHIIEKNQGRIRKRKWAPRTLDIDILFYGNRRMRTNNLTLPHPYVMERDFTLVPLGELGSIVQHTTRCAQEILSI